MNDRVDGVMGTVAREGQPGELLVMKQRDVHATGIAGYQNIKYGTER